MSRASLDATYSGLLQLKRNLDAEYVVLDERDEELLVGLPLGGGGCQCMGVRWGGVGVGVCVWGAWGRGTGAIARASGHWGR